jgi:peroxiredoxin
LIKQANKKMRADDLYTLPDGLPIPVDDGACDHLWGTSVPSVKLRSTADRLVDIADISQPLTVMYCYPRTGTPDRDPLGGRDVWNAIPGARGCTPQACAFRDHHQELQALGAQVFGLSTQTTEYQQEMVERLHLPFEVLSDAELILARALSLPTFQVEGQELIKRLTLVMAEGKIIQIFYPVFPADEHAEEVVQWLRK